MYLKLSFKEQTHPRCMDLSVDYMLAEMPVIVETLPAGAEANKQVRIPDAPGLNDMFGLFNACHYDYYLDCGDADRETIQRVKDALLEATGGKLPLLTADEQYLKDNNNLVVHAIKFSLDTLKRDKGMDANTLKGLIEKEMTGEMQKHAKESMKNFLKLMMFGEDGEAGDDDLAEVEKVFESELAPEKPGLK